MNQQRKRIFVNALTFGRALFVVAFMALAIWHAYAPRKGAFDWSYDWAALTATLSLVIASLTDLFDGQLARKWKVVSRFGAMADPLMDKIFYLVVFPTLLWLLGRQPEEHTHTLVMLIFTVLYILRDQWVTFLRSVGSLFNANCSAMWVGKFRTAASFPSACLIYLYATLHPFFIPLGLIYALEGFLILINCLSIITYTRAYMPYIKKALE